MIKKFIAIMLCFCLMGFAGCGVESIEDVSNEPTNNPPAEESVPESSEESYETEVSEEPSTEENSNEEPSDEESTSSEIDFEEVTLVDDDYVTVKVTGVGNDWLWGYTLKAYIENKTDYELMYSISNCSVNGYMCDPFWATTVSPGMKSNEEISFPTDVFEQCNITEVTDIHFDFTVYDSENWEGDYLVDDSFDIYPLGENAVKNYARESQATDTVLIDNDTCTIIAVEAKTDSIWGYTVTYFLENKTDKELMFSVDGVSINGYMCDPFWATTVSAGKKAYSDMSWSTDDFELNDITDVEEITLPFTVYDSEDIFAGNLVEETVTFNP